MNDEIKEMLEQMESIAITGKNKNGIKVDGYGLQQNELKILLDYITNLQQENERLKAQLTDTEWEYQNARCKYEKQYKKGITEEVIEDIETCFFNRENPSMIPIDSLDVCHIFGYIDYLEDYKSRCEKAIEYNYELQERYCHSAIFDELVASKVYEITEKELNILQNGSDSQ